jgi:fatty-acyl-CoA synthase
MANYKVPRAVTFVDDLPQTASGKVQKFELRRRLGSFGQSRAAPRDT